MTVPGVDTDAGEGGLLGLAVSPHYARDRLVYAYFTSAERQPDRALPARRPRRSRSSPASRAAEIHDGGRIAFGPDGKLYAGVGETGSTALAQDLGSLNGKILRMNPDGSVPADNPFAGSRVWSLGHRNVQGLAWDRAGHLWATEFGQNTFDEVNLIRPGRNYGWPVVEGTRRHAGRQVHQPGADVDADLDVVAERRGDRRLAALRRRAAVRLPLADPDPRRRAWASPSSCSPGATGACAPSCARPTGRCGSRRPIATGAATPRTGDDRIVRIRP